jgi:CDP-glycerol glycerophosphotransferase (TagB/SpsB family)
MSAGELIKEIVMAILKVIRGILGWVIVAPIAKLIPKRRDWIAVVGRDDGKFLDNAKYFFLQGAEVVSRDLRLGFVTERDDVRKLLSGSGREVLVFPSWRSIWFLIRSNVLIVDSSEWILNFKRFLLIGAKKVQLWHGVGYKRIELDKWRNEPKGNLVLSARFMPHLRRLMKTVNGRIVRFDVVNTTSAFYRDKVFKPAMLGRDFLVSGYPRNTFGQVGGEAERWAWSNVDPLIKSRLKLWTEVRRRIVLVAPTFRDSRGSQIGLSAGVTDLLDEICEKEKIEFVFKFHPLEHGFERVGSKHIHLCDPDSDLYPLMPLSSALVTDYSSIYMDYLLLDKPVLFLVPDLDDYIHRDRQLQFDFHEMTPGPKLKSWNEVMVALIEQWEKDGYAEERARLRRLAFDDLPQDQAVPKLIAYMKSQGWLNAPSEGKKGLL